jgi:hypothetical protein
MANWFVRSLATGTGAGTSWTNATTTIAAAITLSSAGDTLFIADDHAETGAAALSLTFKGTFNNPDTVVCVDHTIASPGSGDLKTTASISTTGTTSAISLSGYFYMYGITWNCGTSTSASALSLGAAGNYFQVFEACKFVLGGTGAASIVVTGTTASPRTIWYNCTTKFGAVGQTIKPQAGQFEWKNTVAAVDTGGSLPTNLIQGSGTGNVFAEGVDFSALGSGKKVFDGSFWYGVGQIKDCKLGSAVTTASGASNQLTYRIDCIRTDSANTNYRVESFQFYGTTTTETTIVRTGGATDGTTGFSQKIVTNANGNVRYQAFELNPIAIWNDTTGSAKTITVEGIASAVPNNDQVWMEVEYLGDSTSPQGSRASTYKANALATSAANTTSTSTWGGALTGKFKMAVTITPQQKGPITVYVKMSQASSTCYIDPFITVT